MIRHLLLLRLLVAIFIATVVAHLERMLFELMLAAQQQMIFHQVDERCLDIARLSHRIVQVESLLISETSHEDVIEVSVDLRIIRTILIQL